MALHERKLPNKLRDDDAWHTLRRMRLPLACVVALVFALAQVAEALLLSGIEWRTLLLLDMFFWAAAGALAAWSLLTWAVAQEQRHQSAQVNALVEQRRLNAALQHANSNLALLNEVNRRIASSATPDEVLDYAISLPARVVGARAATLVLEGEWCVTADEWERDAHAPLVIRAQGLEGVKLNAVRTAFGLDQREHASETLLLPLLDSSIVGEVRTAGLELCLLAPLIDGQVALGWVECFLPSSLPPADDGRELLQTIAGEVAEALGAARRRSQALEARYALDRAVEEERARIARDMHDGIAQSLAFLRMRADLWNDWLESEPDRLPAEFAKFKATLRDQIDELRRAIFALRPLDLNELGFAGALRRVLDDYAAQQSWSASLAIDELPELLPAIELACFRLVQESLNNVAKHAAARNVDVVLELVDGGLSMAVADDGRGFDPGSIESSDRLGLRQMRERIASLGGRLTIISRPGEGTEIRAWVPL